MLQAPAPAPQQHGARKKKTKRRQKVLFQLLAQKKRKEINKIVCPVQVFLFFSSSVLVPGRDTCTSRAKSPTHTQQPKDISFLNLFRGKKKKKLRKSPQKRVASRSKVDGRGNQLEEKALNSLLPPSLCFVCVCVHVPFFANQNKMS